MRIGLNATCFNDRPSGANQRFRGIYGALIARCPDFEFVVYEPADCEVGRWFGDAPNVIRRPTPLLSTSRIRRTWAGTTFWRSAFKRDKLDLFEMFNLPLVRAPGCPTILTVHDARPVLRDVPFLKRLVFGQVLRRDLRRADRVITVSETMAREILQIEPEAQVEVVYNGIDRTPFDRSATAAAEATRKKMGLPTDFLLAVGHLEARKNYPRLIEAVAQLNRTSSKTNLVIVGNDGGEGAAIKEQIRSNALEAQILLLSGVSDAELADLYSIASLVVFPSTYEGFGIPVLEAMAAGRPLVLSDTAVFRELTEGQGAYFPAEDSHALAGAIQAVLHDQEAQRALVAYGDRRVADFTFPALAARVESVYRAVV